MRKKLKKKKKSENEKENEAVKVKGVNQCRCCCLYVTLVVVLNGLQKQAGAYLSRSEPKSKTCLLKWQREIAFNYKEGFTS